MKFEHVSSRNLLKSYLLDCSSLFNEKKFDWTRHHGSDASHQCMNNLKEMPSDACCAASVPFTLPIGSTVKYNADDHYYSLPFHRSGFVLHKLLFSCGWTRTGIGSQTKHARHSVYHFYPSDQTRIVTISTVSIFNSTFDLCILPNRLHYWAVRI